MRVASAPLPVRRIVYVGGRVIGLLPLTRAIDGGSESSAGDAQTLAEVKPHNRVGLVVGLQQDDGLIERAAQLAPESSDPLARFSSGFAPCPVLWRLGQRQLAAYGIQSSASLVGEPPHVMATAAGLLDQFRSFEFLELGA